MIWIFISNVSFEYLYVFISSMTFFWPFVNFSWSKLIRFPIKIRHNYNLFLYIWRMKLQCMTLPFAWNTLIFKTLLHSFSESSIHYTVWTLILCILLDMHPCSLLVRPDFIFWFSHKMPFNHVYIWRGRPFAQFWKKIISLSILPIETAWKPRISYKRSAFIPCPHFSNI